MTRPSPSHAPLNAGASGRSPWGTAMLAASSREHIARRAGLGRAGARPGIHRFPHCGCLQHGMGD